MKPFVKKSASMTKHLVNFVAGCLLLSLTTSFGVEAQRAPLLFGTLLTDPAHAQQEYAAGIRIVHLELGWSAYEPHDNQFSARYMEQVRAKLAAYRQAGCQVVLGTGLQYPPKWLFELPGSRYVNQDGVAVPRIANLTFSPVLRQRAERFLARVAQDLGTDFCAVRVGSGGSIECFYPAWDAADTRNSYWAFDANAQQHCPFPGWKPGERQYRGQPFTPQQVAQWYDWYLGAMVDGINWQLGIYRRLGYRGELQVLLPGQGTRPQEYARGLARYLEGDADHSHTMSRAAVWHKVIERLGDRRNVTIYVSSVADGSGGNDLSQPSDRAVALDDPAINRWSATRWLTYLADRQGMAKSGENPGRGDAPGYGLDMLTAAVAQAQAGGFGSFLWAHDHNLYDGTGPTLAEYGAVIRQSSSAQR